MPTRKVVLDKSGQTIEIHFNSEEEFVSRVQDFMADFPKLKVHEDHSWHATNKVGEKEEHDWDSVLRPKKKNGGK